MPKGRSPPRLPTGTAPPNPLGILELERFSDETLTKWTSVSEDLDELQAALYFGVLPEQRRLQQALVEAVQEVALSEVSVSRWVRIVTYQYSMEPLSAGGSLHSVGGRFNAGADLDPGTLRPWPALYIAEDHETAFREKFQMQTAGTIGGLSAEEMALAHRVSHSTVFLDGTLRSVFDMTSAASLNSVARVLGRIKMPPRARLLQKRLRIPNKSLWMISTGSQLYSMVLTQNWRTLPAQFGLPAPGHTLASLIRSAGFEAIMYRSTKGQGRCLAVFPDKLTSGSFLQLADGAPRGAKHTRLDADSSDDLAGWNSLPSQQRPG